MNTRPPPKVLHVVAGMLLCVGLAVYTTNKLYRMARIRGFAGSSEIEKQAVTGKRSEDVRGRRGSTRVCWLHWQTDRVQADCDYCETVRVGDTIELVTVDGETYLKAGEIYASDGNFAFDFVLLAAELGGIVVCIVLLRRARRNDRHRIARADPSR